MLNRLVTRTPAAALVCTLLVAGCGRSDAPTPLTDEDGILGFVPADTPYVFVTAEKMPDAVLDKLEASSDSMFAAYQTVIGASMRDMAAEFESSGDEARARRIMSLAGKFVELLQSENLRAAGVPRGAQAAAYGAGLAPVFRLELTNPLAFEAKIAEIEADADGEMLQDTVSGTDYRYFGDDSARIVLSVTGEYFVTAVVPAGLSDERLAEVLGLDKPARSLADTDTLAGLASDYGLTAYGLGFFDVGRAAATFLDDPSGVNAELLSMAGYDAASLSAVCRDDIRAMAAVVPRFVAGYTSVTAEAIGSNAIIEIRPDLATGLTALAASVPGLGQDHGGLFSFGVSVDLLAARNFVEERLDALDAAPYECEYFSDLQSGVAQLRQTLNQPVPPIIYGSKGFIAVIDSIEGLDVEGRQPPEEVDARLLIANDNAEGLLAMGAMFSPEIAALSIQPDGRPVALPLPQLTQMFDAAYVALTKSALGVSVGTDSGDRLASLMAGDTADPPPSISVRLDGRRYYEFMSEAVRAGSAAGGVEGEDMPEDLQEALSQVMAGVGDAIERIAVDVTLTPRGVEMPATVTLAD